MKRIDYRPHIFLLTFLCLFASYAHGQTGIRTFDFATIAAPSTVDVLRADANGNIYVAGKYFGNAAIDFSPYGTQAPLTDTGTTTDIYIAKYDAGGVLLWLRNVMNEQSTFLEVTDLEVDASGNVFVAGSVTGNAAKFYDATTNHDVSGGAASYTGAYVVKYSSAGAITWVWNKKHATTQYYAKGIEIDGSGNIHVGGYTNDGGGNEVSVAVLNSAGSEQSYHTLTTISSAVTVAAFDRDASGNYYFTGSTNGGTPEAFVSKFNSSRVHQWNSVVRNFTTAGGTGGGFAERGVDIEVDGSGNVFALFNGSSDAFLTKYNSSGTFQSASFRLSAANGNTGRDLALDASGNVIIAGNLRGTTDFDPGAGTANGGDSFGSYYLASYTSNLAYNWSRILNHNSQTSTRISASADVDPLGKIHIAQHWDNTGYRKGLITTYSLAGDVTAPTATTLNPADNATNVALSVSPQITFSESVSLVNGGTVTIKKLSNLSDFETFTIPSAALTLSGNTLTINPTSDFPVTSSTSSYYVTISGGAIRDAAGNFFAPITTSNIWNFSTIVDSSGPALISRTPTPGSTGIDPAGNLTIGFTENIVAHTGGSVTLQKLISGAYSTIQTFSLPSGLVGITGAQATINPSADLSYSSTYQVLVSSNAFKDAAGNFFAGQTAGAWTFATEAAPDAVAPTVASYSPADNASTASITGDLILTLNENITGVSSKVINLIQTSGTTLIESFTLPSAKVQVSGNTVTINPTLNLAYNTAYHVTVEAGAFEDAAGNDFAGVTNNTTWNFTTQADPSDLAPFLTTLSPANGATGVNRRTDLEAGFSELVNFRPNKNLYIRNSGGTVVEQFNTTTSSTENFSIESGIYINPVNTLPGSTSFYITFDEGLVEDASTNPVAALNNNTTWTFTTAAADVTGPALSSSDPGSGEVNVSDELSAISLQFNEDVSINTGTITISGSGFNETIDVTTSENIENESDGLVILYLDGQLPNNTAITVSAPVGSFVDDWGNNSQSVNFSFTTEPAPDNAGPTVTTYFPTIGETNVPFQRWLSLTFNETVQFAPAADKYLRIYNSSDVLVDQVLVVSGSFSTIASGTILRLYYQKNLEFGVEHYATLDAGAVKDMSGNDFGGIAAGTWYFTIESESGALGRYSNFAPAKNATGVDNSLDQLSFNLYFPNKQGGTIALRKVSDNALVKEWAVTDAEVTVTGGGFTVNATNIPELEYSTEYFVELTGTSFSANGELSWGAFYAPEYLQYQNWNDDNTFWRFTTEAEPDTQEPTLVSISPADDATDVGIDTDLVVTFSENIVANAGLITIKKLDGNNIHESFNVNGGATIVDNILTIEPTIDLDYNTEYFVDFGIGVVKDAAENTFAGISGNPNWTFTTESSGFSPTSYSPAAASTDADVNTNLSITFNENVSISAGTISIHRVSDDVAVATLSNYNGSYMTIDGATITFDFIPNLPAGELLYVNVSSGYLKSNVDPAKTWPGIQDNTTWRFTTAPPPDETAPTISSLLPADNATGVSVSTDLVVTFSENIVANSGLVSVRKTAGNSLHSSYNVSSDGAIDGDMMTIELSSDLEYSTEYYIDLGTGLVKDAANNTFAGLSGNPNWTFTTLSNPDVAAPVIVATVPDYNGVTDVPVNTPFSLTFNENIQPGEGMIRLKVSGQDVEVIDPNDMTIEGSSASYTLTADLPYNSTVQVIVEQDAFRDLAGNQYSNPSNGVNYSFTTETDVDTPGIEQLAPAHRAVQVANDLGSISIVFDEAIQVLDQDAVVSIKRYDDDAALLSVPMSSTSVTVDDNTLTIDFTEEFAFETIYYVLLEAGAIGDLANNEFGGITSKNAWKFHTQKAAGTDTQAPYLVFFSPENNAEGVAVDERITLYFNENISLPVNGATKAVTISSLDNVQFTRQYFMAGSNITATISGNKIEINDPGLHYYTTFKAKINDAVLRDAGNNLIGVIETDDYWTFSTSTDPDLTGISFPDVLEKAPANNATGVYLGIYDWYMKFDSYGNVQPNRLSSGKVRVYKSGNAAPVFELSASNTEHLYWYQQDDSDFVGFTMQGGFDPSATYYIKMDEGVIMDFSTGKPMAAISDQVTWTFTTESQQAVLGLFESFTPERGAEAVSTDLTELSVEFTKDVYHNNNPVRLKKVEDNSLVKEWYLTSGNTDFEIENNRTLRLKNITLEEGTEYYVEQTFTGDEMILQFDDHYLAPWANDFWTFTTAAADQTAPVISSYDPSVNSTHSGVNDNFLAYFSESVNAIDGKKVEVRRYDNDEVIQSTTFPSDFASIGSGVLVINAENSWPESTELYVLIDNGAAEDLAGNPFAGITSKDTWKFSIAGPDTAGPEVVSTSPADGDTDVAIASLEIAIEFDEDIASGPDATLVNVSGYGDIDITAFEGASLSENYLYLDLSGLLPSETEITVTLPEGVVVDNDGNLSQEYFFSFTTEDNGKENQEITFTEIPDKNYGDAAFDLEASSDSGLEVNFEIVSGPVTLNGNTVTITGAGQATIKATQAGDGDFNAATPVERSFSIGKKAQAITITAIGDKLTTDGAFEIEASVDSELELTYELSGPATLEGATVTLSGEEGTVTLLVSQAGNDNYLAAEASETFEVAAPVVSVKEDQIITFASIAGKTFGDEPFALEATASSELPVTFEVVSGQVSIDGSTVTITGAGQATIKATQAGDDDFNAATPVERSFSIGKKAQAITITAINDKLTTDGAFEIEASVDSELELTYELSGPATLEGTTVILSGEEGSVTVLVSQAGNDNYLAAEASETFEVTAPVVSVKEDQTISFAGIVDKTFGDEPFALQATASSELPVTFEVVSGQVTIDGSTVTITGAGQATIKATQAGDDSFNAATPVEKSFSVAKRAQVITIAAIDDKLTTDGAFEIEASVDSERQLTYEISGPATLEGTTVTLSGEEGTVTVLVSQAGNNNYLPAEASETLEVTAPPASTFAISGTAITSSDAAFSNGQAKLRLRKTDGSFAAAISAPLSGAGAFSFSDLATGQYVLEINSNDAQILTTYYDAALALAEATLIEVTNADVSGITVEMKNTPTPLSGPGSIKGTLLLAADGGRQIVTDGRVFEGTPLAGVTIYLVKSPGNELVAATTTAADGSFAFNNLPLGAYKLLVDYEGKTSIESPEIVITETSLSFDVASKVTEDGIVIVAEPTVTNGVNNNQLLPLLTVYPNPSSGVVTLQWDGSMNDILEIIIHNNNGSAVWRGNVSAVQQTVDISQHPSGVYFLRLITNKGTAIQKLVIK